MPESIRFNAKGRAVCGCVVTQYSNGWEVEPCAVHERSLPSAGDVPDLVPALTEALRWAREVGDGGMVPSEVGDFIERARDLLVRAQPVTIQREQLPGHQSAVWTIRDRHGVIDFASTKSRAINMTLRACETCGRLRSAGGAPAICRRGTEDHFAWQR